MLQFNLKAHRKLPLCAVVLCPVWNVMSHQIMFYELDLLICSLMHMRRVLEMDIVRLLVLSVISIIFHMYSFFTYFSYKCCTWCQLELKKNVTITLSYQKGQSEVIGFAQHKCLFLQLQMQLKLGPAGRSDKNKQS